MKVQVRLFALHRERAGISSLELELPLGATVSQVAEELLSLYPSISSDSSTLVIAVNQEYVEHSSVLQEGDEVAFIPPVSGGSHD